MQQHHKLLSGLTKVRLPLLLLTLVWAPATLTAVTMKGSVGAYGQDDSNSVQLIDLQYFQTCIYITQGAASAGFTPANGWQFSYAATPVAAGDFTVNLYSAWVVTNDVQTDPGGTMRSRPVANADAGGANFAITYTPTAAGDPTGIHFIQAYYQNQTMITGGTEDRPVTTNTQGIFLDNLGSAATPFYDVAGGVSRIGAGRNVSWLFDIPYDCENSGTPNAPSPTCSGGTDGFLLSSQLIFQTFVAVDRGAIAGTGIAHDVILYGGEQWGSTYTNTDTPEPSFGILGGVVLLGIVWRNRFRSVRG